jgi:hypothetical protein
VRVGHPSEALDQARARLGVQGLAVMSGSLMNRIKNRQRRAASFRERIEEGARAGDDD